MIFLYFNFLAIWLVYFFIHFHAASAPLSGLSFTYHGASTNQIARLPAIVVKYDISWPIGNIVS
jgi:hypothetical protein